MDKNMIKIDDLVRQRLSGGEDRERPGAWLQMRDVLDKEMPLQSVTGGYNWRRMFAAATGLLLIASLTMGGYKIYNSWRVNSEEVKIAANSKAIHRSLDNNIHSLKDIENKYDQSSASLKTVENKNIAENTTFSDQQNVINNEINTDERIEKSAGLYTEQNNTTEGLKINKQVNAANKSGKVAGSSNRNNQLSNSSKQTSQPIASSTVSHNRSSANNSSIHNSHSSNNTTSLSKTNISNPASSNPVNAEKPINNTTTPVIAKTNDQGELKDVTQKDKLHKNELKLIKDSMQKISIVQRTKIDKLSRKVTFYQDTSSIVMIAKPIPDEVIVLNSGVASASASQTTAKKATNEKSANRKTDGAGSLWNSQAIKDRIDNTKFRLAQIQFFPGVTFGVNSYLFGAYNLHGWQAGLTGNFIFNEKWQLLTALKYIQRFNNNNTIQDNYSTNQSGGVSEVAHFFKFSALHSIEMPIALKFAFNRLHLFSGANLAYNFKASAEEVTRPYTSQSTPLPPSQTAPSIQLSDFSGRFSVGGLLGLGYDATPSLSIDLRVNKNFWDNAKTSGAKLISDQLYRAPSFQLSIGYKFNQQRNKIPKAQ